MHSIDYPSALYAVEAILKDIGLNYSVIDYVREKETHGDLDIIVHNEGISAHEVTNILRKKNIIATQTSSQSLSFLLLTFQVDLIYINPDRVPYAKNYFSWNDLGNLIGRLAKQFGIKHGHDGLYFVQRFEQDRVLKEHLLSTDYATVLNILQLDTSKFDKGFDTFVEMFEWVSSSPYFNPEIFQFEKLNNRNRVRDRKRKVYNMFLDWISSQDFSDHFKSDHVRCDENVLKLFPEIKEEYYRLVDVAEETKLIREKFNGKLLSGWTGLSGKHLGGFITQFRNHFNNETLLNSSMDDIENLVKSFYKDNYIELSD